MCDAGYPSTASDCDEELCATSVCLPPPRSPCPTTATSSVSSGRETSAEAFCQGTVPVKFLMEFTLCVEFLVQFWASRDLPTSPMRSLVPFLCSSTCLEL